jgi:hypothetical protein
VRPELLMNAATSRTNLVLITLLTLVHAELVCQAEVSEPPTARANAGRLRAPERRLVRPRRRTVTVVRHAE